MIFGDLKKKSKSVRLGINQQKGYIKEEFVKNGLIRMGNKVTRDARGADFKVERPNGSSYSLEVKSRKAKLSKLQKKRMATDSDYKELRY